MSLHFAPGNNYILHHPPSNDGNTMDSSKSEVEKVVNPVILDDRKYFQNIEKTCYATPRRANNGVSQYPSYQRICQLAENFQNIYRSLTKSDESSLNFL